MLYSIAFLETYCFLNLYLILKGTMLNANTSIFTELILSCDVIQIKLNITGNY